MHIKEVIKQQDLFSVQVILTNLLLKCYAGNQEDFELLLGDDVEKHYKYKDCNHNPEYIWETIDELTCDLVYGDKKFNITHNGLFPVLVFAKNKKKKVDAPKVIEAFTAYAQGKWEI